MAAKKVLVTYVDPEREPIEVTITPRAQVQTERHIGGDWAGLALLSVYYMAWAAMVAKAPTEIPGFEAWLDSVESVEDVVDAKPDPTESGLSDEVSLS